MMQNPILQAVLFLFGAYTGLSMLKRKAPTLGLILTIAAGVIAVIVYMLRYNRAQLSTFYLNPLLKPVIDFVCSITKENPPTEGSVSALTTAPASASGGGGVGTMAMSAPAQGVERPRPAVSARAFQGASSDPAPATGSATSTGAAATPAPAAAAHEPKLLLQNPADWATAAYQVKERVRGCDASIDAVFRQMQTNARLRERSVSRGSLPPVGIFLFVGDAGLGKRTLAMEIGKRLYPDNAVGLLDLAESGATLQPMISSAKGNGYQTFVIENLNRATHNVQNDVLAICAGQPLVDANTGTRVEFRHSFLFLILHQDASNFPMEQVVSTAGTGFTRVVDHLVQNSELDQMLALALHGAYPFVLPEKQEQAEVVAMIMERECWKYNLNLASVSPHILAREVEEVSKVKSFRTIQARAQRILAPRISEALAVQATEVRVET